MSLVREIMFGLTKIYYLQRIKKKAKSYAGKVYVGGKSFVTANTELGKNVSINGMGISGNGRVVIGDNFHSGPGCQIITSFHNYEGEAIPYDDTFLDKDVIIGDNVWIGNNVIILGGVTIGEGVIVQAGSVVCKDIPPYAIAGGHPATQFKYRDRFHYDKLKEEGKFH